MAVGSQRPSTTDCFAVVAGVRVRRAQEIDQAIKWLETAYAEHSPRLVPLLTERDLVGLHGDAWFQELVRRVGLRESD